MKKAIISIVTCAAIFLSSATFAKHIYFINQGINGPVYIVEKQPKIRYVEYVGPFAIVHKVHRFHPVRYVYF